MSSARLYTIAAFLFLIAGVLMYISYFLGSKGMSALLAGSAFFLVGGFLLSMVARKGRK